MTVTTTYTDLDRVRALAAYEVAADEHLALRDDNYGVAASWARCRDRARTMWAELPRGWQDDAVLWPAYQEAGREHLQDSLAVMA